MANGMGDAYDALRGWLAGGTGGQGASTPAPDYAAVEKLLRQVSPDPSSAFAAVKDARGENLGSSVNPLLAGKSPEELAILDRYSSAQHNKKALGTPMAMLAALPMAGYEGVKGISQNVPGMEGLLKALGSLPAKVAGDEKNVDEFYTQNARTSPASMENVMAYLRGLILPTGE